jgi:hypothetical protein
MTPPWTAAPPMGDRTRKRVEWSGSASATISGEDPAAGMWDSEAGEFREACFVESHLVLVLSMWPAAALFKNTADN